MLEPLRPGLAKLAHSNAVLHGLDLAEPDPVLRFRRHVDSAEYVAALKIAGGAECTLVEADDIRRHLHGTVGPDGDLYRQPTAYFARPASAQADSAVDVPGVASKRRSPARLTRMPEPGTRSTSWRIRLSA